MPYDDLREFVEKVERSGELIRVKVDVDLKYEVGAVCSRNYDLGGLDHSKALAFEKPKGYDTPLIVNLLGTGKRYCMAIDTTPEQFTQEWVRRTRHPIEPITVEHAPCQENVHVGEEVDLFELPIPIWNEKDGGPYITLPHHVSKDPETGQQNVGIYRAQVHDKRTLGILAAPYRHINIHWRKAHAGGKSFPVAIAIGVDPAITLAANGPFPEGIDEFAMAGALRGAPVQLVHCKTVPLKVPATAEWVLEGEVKPNARKKEGPFGEGCGYYGSVAERPIIEIKAITHRNNPIHQAVYLRRPPSEALSIKRCWQAEAFNQCPLPGLLKLNFPEGGCVGAIAIASIKKTFDGQGKMMGMAILGTPAGLYIKIVVVVDEDIDPFNLTDVLWAMSTRFQPRRDLEVIKDVTGWGLDPSMPQRSRELGTNLVSKMIIDATKPIKEAFAEVISPKKDIFERVCAEWEKYGIS